MSGEMKEEITNLLKGIDRYNPENLQMLEKYVILTATENTYDIEAYLAVLKLYQFTPQYFKLNIVTQILLKSLTNLPHSDYALCKYLIELPYFESKELAMIEGIANLLEECQFLKFWDVIDKISELTDPIVGFNESIRKFICHVVEISYQQIAKSTLSDLLNLPESELKVWISRYNWKEAEEGHVYIDNQEDIIKTKNITEKITFDGIAGIMQLST